MPNRLRIITYNVHRCIGGDRKIVDLLQSHEIQLMAGNHIGNAFRR